MKEFLFLFHSTVGVIQTRKALQAAGMTFRVSDIPRDLLFASAIFPVIYAAAAGYAFG